MQERIRVATILREPEADTEEDTKLNPNKDEVESPTSFEEADAEES